LQERKKPPTKTTPKNPEEASNLVVGGGKCCVGKGNRGGELVGPESAGIGGRRRLTNEKTGRKFVNKER